MHLKEKVKPLSATAEATTRSHDKEMIAVKAQATGKMPQQQRSAPVDVMLCWPRVSAIQMIHVELFSSYELEMLAFLVSTPYSAQN